MPRDINNRMQNYLLNPASVAYSNPQKPLTPIVDPTTNNLTTNLTYYLNNNAAGTAAQPGISSRGGRWAALLIAAAGS